MILELMLPILLYLKKIDSLPKNLSILDAGCWEGYVSRYLAKQWHKVTWVDLSSFLIEAAQQIKINSESYQIWDVTHLDFPDASFDVVISNFVLIDMKNPVKAIEEISRVLKVWGRFIFQWLHPFCFASNTGETNWQKVVNYFQTQKFLEKFIVDNLVSPEETTRYHYPLNTYTEALNKNNLIILSLSEPVPIESTPADHKIRETFKEPWIILIDTLKYFHT